MRRMMIVSAVAMAAVALIVVPATVRATTHAVEIADNFFSPNFVVADQGDTIRWTHTGQMPHTVTESMMAGTCTMRVDGFSSGTLQNGDVFIWVADRAGDLAYYCEFHCPPMMGEIIVQESTPVDAATWGTVKSLYR